MSRGRLEKREESFRNQGFYENCPELVKKRNKFFFMVEGSEIVQNVSEESIHRPFCRGFSFFCKASAIYRGFGIGRYSIQNNVKNHRFGSIYKNRS